VTLTLESLQYVSCRQTHVVRPGQPRTLRWPSLHGWHDIQIVTSEDVTSRRRLTGRVEDGRVGISG